MFTTNTHIPHDLEHWNKILNLYFTVVSALEVEKLPIEELQDFPKAAKEGRNHIFFYYFFFN